jgi:DNA-nicking Smr family endonuclease
MSRKRRNLTDEEQSLWNRVAQKVKPLPKDQKRITSEPPSPYRPLRKKPAFSLPAEEHSSSKSQHSQTNHRIQRVRKVEIEARLDLHGLTFEQARLRLAKFLIKAQENRYLWVLVITGKGKQRLVTEDYNETPPRRTLRDHVPRWLEEPFLHTVVSAYTTAKPQDGGSGALYVRLKRLSH